MRDEVLHITKGNIPPVSRYFGEKEDFICIHGIPFDSECGECIEDAQIAKAGKERFLSRHFTKKEDMRPIVPHYQSGGIEPIDYINSHNFNFNLGCVVKYITRAGKKGDAVTDLKKAIDYLNFEIERIGDDTKHT